MVQPDCDFKTKQRILWSLEKGTKEIQYGKKEKEKER